MSLNEVNVYTNTNDEMRRQMLTMLCFVAGIMCVKAQIGYQVSLLNTATGEARANETVTVTVSLSNSAGEIFYSETKQSTTNDFGVLSLTVGNADTFKNVDLSKMPFYIEVTANGVMIGKSQMLSVPVAEVAKQVAPIDVVGKWQRRDNGEFSEVFITFFNDGTGYYESHSYDENHSEVGTRTRPFTYIIEGNCLLVIYDGAYERAPYLFLLINGYLMDEYHHDFYTLIKQ